MNMTIDALNPEQEAAWYEDDSLAEPLAREALRGFFGDSSGFEDMSTSERHHAVSRVREFLARKNGRPW